MFMKREPTPHTTEESGVPPSIIEINDLNLDEENDDEIEASLKELFPSQSEVSVLGLKRELPSLSRSACLQLQNQNHHILLKVKTQEQQLENKLRNCFDNFEKVNALRMMVLNRPLIKF
jgi:hypothetical protein